MLRRFILLAILICGSSARAGEPQFPLLGSWHSVSATAPDGRDVTPKDGGLEVEFLSDGVMIQTIASSSRAAAGPIRYRCGYIFQPPDRVDYTYTRDGQVTTQQQRFLLVGDTVTFRNLDSGIITAMRRIKHSLIQSPRQVSELPK